MMTDEQLLLATAYVDDELTLSERARAEGDPVVWDEIQRQRSIQQMAGTIPPYSHAVAQAQIEAAIASAGVTKTDSDAETKGVAPVVHLADRRRRNLVLGGSIAAGLLIAVAGVSFLGNRNASDGSSSSATAADYAPAATTTPMAASEATQADEMDSGTMPADAASEETLAAEGTYSATVTDTGAPAGAPDESVVLTFANQDELLQVGRMLVAQAALQILDRPTAPCDITSESGEVLSPLATAVYGPDQTTVLIAVDLAAVTQEKFVVVAADSTTCEVVMSAQGSIER